jgi:hypothetical protein
MDEPKMLHKLIVGAAWSCLAFIIYATVSPIDARPVIAGGYFTVLERCGAYALLGILFYFAYPRHLVFVCIVVLGSAITLEIVQNFTSDRHARLLDATEKLLGGAAGLMLAGSVQSIFWSKWIGGRPQRS